MCLHQDNKGYIWIGTKGGVSRFDGIEFRNFTKNDGLLANHITNIFEDSSGRLYMLSYLGLNVLDEDTIRTVYLNDTIDQYRSRIFVFKKNGFELWLTKDNRIDVIAGQRKGIRIPLPPELEGKKLTNAIWLENLNEYWLMVEDEGIYSWAGKNVLFRQKFQNSRMYYINDTTIALSSLNVVYRINPENNTTEEVIIHNESNLGRQTNDRYGTLYFTDLERILVCDAEGSRWLNREFNYINAMMIDAENHLWIATETGLYKKISNAFENFTPRDGVPEYIWTMVEDQNGDIWCASYGDGLCRISEGVVERITHYRAVYNAYDRDYFYTGAMRCRNGDLLFPVKNSGVLRYDGLQFEILPNMPEGSVMHAAEDTASNQFLFASTAGPLIWKDPGDVEFIEYINRDSKRYVKTITIDKFGRYWLGGEYVLQVFDGDTLISFPNEQYNYSAGAVSIHMDHNKNLWIGTTSGLYFHDYKTFRRIASETLSSQVSSFAESEDSLLYMGISEGLGIIDLEEFYSNDTIFLRILDSSQGFLGFDCIRNGMLLDSRGDLWVAASEQLIRFHPDTFQVDTISPEVYIQEGILTGSATQSNRVLSTQSDSANEVASTYTAIRFDYHTIHFYAPEKVRYSYRLKGYSNVWSPETKERYASYTNLSPGTYCFEVRAKNVHGVWSKQPTSLEFTIVPAFWQTWQFRVGFNLLITLLVFGLGYALFAFLRRRKEKRQETEREIMELQLKTIRSQMDPHFTFNALNTISSVIYKEDKEKAYRYMGKFSRLVRSSLEFSDQIARTLKEELTFTLDYLDMEKIRFRDHFEYSLEKDPAVDESILVPKMILQNYVENAVKHGLRHKPTDRCLWIRIRHQNGFLQLEIEDNGVGRRTAENQKDFSSGRGLKIMSGIYDLYYKLYGIRIDQTIEDLFDPLGQARGTLVRVRMPVTS